VWAFDFLDPLEQPKLEAAVRLFLSSSHFLCSKRSRRFASFWPRTHEKARSITLRALPKFDGGDCPSLAPTRLADGLELRSVLRKMAKPHGLPFLTIRPVSRFLAGRWFPRVARPFLQLPRDFGRQIINGQIVRPTLGQINRLHERSGGAPDLLPPVLTPRV
jgi:hypothetical protein